MKLAMTHKKAEVKLEESNSVQEVSSQASKKSKGECQYGDDIVGCLRGVAAILVLLMAAAAFGGFLHQRIELEVVKGQVRRLEEAISKMEVGENRRQKRQAVESNEIDLGNLSEDGVPILERKRKHGRKVNRHGRTGGQGFRVYDAWFQHRRENEIPNDPRVVWTQPSDSPIRAHHRKSASWVTRHDEDDYDDIHLFEKKSRKKVKKHSNTITHTRNRAKVTNIKEYEAKEYKTAPAPETTTPTIASSSAATTVSTSSLPAPVQQQQSSSLPAPAQLNQQQQSSSLPAPAQLNQHLQTVEMRAARNRQALRAGDHKHRRGRRRHRNRSGLRSSRVGGGGVTGLAAIHMQSKVTDTASPDYEGAGRFNVRDGVFYGWEPARWARRMNMDKQFPFKAGKLSVAQPGVYFVYAQINYLDEHDVNAFQIYVNDSPLLLCTAMTHTPHHTTKANTCYTAGAVFLEQGDQIYIKNLEPNRYAVLLPSHTFFGLVQLSEAGI